MSASQHRSMRIKGFPEYLRGWFSTANMPGVKDSMM